MTSVGRVYVSSISTTLGDAGAAPRRSCADEFGVPERTAVVLIEMSGEPDPVLLYVGVSRSA